MSKKLSKIIYLKVCFVFFLFSDLYLSELLVKNIARGFAFSSKVIALTYVQNSGAAFNILNNSREFLIILSVVALVVIFGYIIKHAKSISMKSIFFSSLLAAGIAGNLHERLVFGFVRDFFELKFVDFPVLILIRKTK